MPLTPMFFMGQPCFFIIFFMIMSAVICFTPDISSLSSHFFFVSLTRGLSILLIFSKKQLSAALIFLMILFSISLNLLLSSLFPFLCLCCVYEYFALPFLSS